MEKDKKDITPGELLDLCVKLNCDDFHIWVDYAGHINGFTIRVEPGGYKEENDSIYLNGGPHSTYLEYEYKESLKDLKEELLCLYAKHTETIR